jgi:hypothetical protein
VDLQHQLSIARSIQDQIGKLVPQAQGDSGTASWASEPGFPHDPRRRHWLVVADEIRPGDLETQPARSAGCRDQGAHYTGVRR